MRRVGPTSVGDRAWRSLLGAPDNSVGVRPRDPHHELHVDADAVCPRCLRWIDPADFVRQTRIGLVQHEICR